jgi:uncharacterized protein YoxC
MLLTISVSVIAAVMVVGVVFLIPILLQIRRTAREVEKLLEAARMQIVPLSHDLTIISQEVNGILKSIHRQVDRVGEGIVTLKDTIVRLREFEEEILHKVEKPLLELATLINAVIRGIETFSHIARR